MRTFIVPSGTSVLRGLNKAGVVLRRDDPAAQLTKDLLFSMKIPADDLSAELSLLGLMNAGAQDEVVFLTTDSGSGTEAAELIQRIASLHFNLQVRIDRVSGLTLDDPAVFLRQGLSSLVDRLDTIVNAARLRGAEPIVGVGAGIKPVVPYVATFALLRHVRMAYVFEQARRVVILPQLPIAFDEDALRRAAGAIRKIARDTLVPKWRVINELGEDFEQVQGLFDESEENLLALSPFGLLLLEDLRVEQMGTVHLSASARDSYDRATGIDRAQFDHMLTRVVNPLWRLEKIHRFAGTDLDVFKPGNSPHRIAGWIEQPNTVMIAELYSSHDLYESDLPGRQREQYRSQAFSHWTGPQRRSQEVLTDEEHEGEEVFRLARAQAERAAIDTAAALRTAEDAQNALAVVSLSLEERIAACSELSAELAVASEELEVLRLNESARASLGLWARLRWALSP